ncbi:hypothetical protein INS49_005020 [Diaporthe citri]|uniref:uncharacterized protein n=1 Tax=Diaporthe citri TaxID=83186 RepID=UPI001C80C4B5|nr:uncharacterized protein INS49_005020 [Diaporthe citri]KAG6354049.1 hypothetical protein INS49_005020 [Diaporthe citri]
MANVGPSTTYSYAVDQLGGTSLQTWIPNAALFPLIGHGSSFVVDWSASLATLLLVPPRSTEVIIGGQAINGVGSSLFLLSIPTGMEIVPADRRNLAQGLMGLINGVISIIALVTGGAFAKMSADGWRWAYLLNAIFFGVSGISLMLLYKPPATRLRSENSTRACDMLRSIDFIGILLLLCAVIGLVTPRTWGGNAYPWNSARVIPVLKPLVVAMA